MLEHLSTTFVQYRCTVHRYCTPVLYTSTPVFTTELVYCALVLILNTGIVHPYCIPVLYTSTIHQYYTPVLYTGTVHQYCTPVIYTITVHQYCVPLLYTITVHQYCKTSSDGVDVVVCSLDTFLELI